MNTENTHNSSMPEPMPDRRTVWGMFESQVQANPDALAVTDVNRTVSYSELYDLAGTLASMFPDEKPGRVGILMDHGVEMIAAILATMRQGGAYVAVEPEFPPERMRFMMRQADVDFIIASPQYASRFVGYSMLTLAPGLRPGNYSHVRAVKTSPSAEAYILYTSGTTGEPKGVSVSNANVVHYARAFENEFHIGPGDVMMQCSVCTFDIFVEEVFATLLNGAESLVATRETASDSCKLLSFAKAHGATIISGFPYLLADFNKMPRRLPESLRLLISGGDVLRAKCVDRLLDKVEVYNTYGPSETTVCASYHRCNGTTPLPDGTYPIGRPVKGAEIMVLDENMCPVPDGSTGEICIAGDGVSHGYLIRNPESANFTTLADGRPVYRSGDLGYRMADGNLAFLRRKDKQIMIDGRRVECDEVENVLCSFDEVEKGVVCPYTDSNGMPYMAAFIVPRDRQLFSLNKLKTKMKKYLTAFMMPDFFVALTKLPLTPNGKVDRDSLPTVLKD